MLNLCRPSAPSHAKDLLLSIFWYFLYFWHDQNALYILLLLWNTGDAVRIHKIRALHRVNLKSLNSLNARRTDMPKLMPCVFERISSIMPQQTTCEKKEISFPYTTSRTAAQRKWYTVTGRCMSSDSATCDFWSSCCYYWK